jgi:hypothetical protein
MQIRNHTPNLECSGALSDLILQAARQALPQHIETLITLPDVGQRNQPLLPLLVGLIDAARVTARAVADNAWDSGQAPPADLISGLVGDLQQCISALRASQDTF